MTDYQECMAGLFLFLNQHAMQQIPLWHFQTKCVLGYLPSLISCIPLVSRIFPCDTPTHSFKWIFLRGRTTTTQYYNHTGQPRTSQASPKLTGASYINLSSFQDCRQAPPHPASTGSLAIMLFLEVPYINTVYIAHVHPLLPPSNQCPPPHLLLDFMSSLYLFTFLINSPPNPLNAALLHRRISNLPAAPSSRRAIRPSIHSHLLPVAPLKVVEVWGPPPLSLL